MRRHLAKETERRTTNNFIDIKVVKPKQFKKWIINEAIIFGVCILRCKGRGENSFNSRGSILEDHNSCPLFERLILSSFFLLRTYCPRLYLFEVKLPLILIYSVASVRRPIATGWYSAVAEHGWRICSCCAVLCLHRVLLLRHAANEQSAPAAAA